MEGMDFAVTDVSGLDTSSGSVDTSADTTTQVSGEESVDTSAEGTEGTSEETEAEGTQEGQQQPGAPFKAVQDGKLSPVAKQLLDKLRTENPQLAKRIQSALFTEDRLYRELPGGFKDLQTLRDRIEQLGGDQGIQELQQETNGWREFDEMYTAGDPKVLEFLTETPEAQAAFLKIAPAAFEKFREANPDGFAAYVSQVFVADMQAQGLPLLLERLADFLPADKPQAKEVWDKIAAYVNRIAQFSQKPVNAPATQPRGGQDDQRAQDIARREANLTRTEWKGEADSRHQSMFRENWKALIGARKLTPQQEATIKELYGLKMQSILKAKSDFNSNLERYFSSKQKDGFLRYFESVYRDAVPKALRTAIQQVLPAKPGPKPGEQPQGQQPQQQQRQAQPKPGQARPGMTMLPAKPDKALVDFTRTTTDMWVKGQAVLKDGKVVSFKRP